MFYVHITIIDRHQQNTVIDTSNEVSFLNTLSNIKLS